ncbi:MAG TPA: DEAD/DEAH box helicase [Verrucomicrobiales bacterium]|nr:DEAD/DEAH box helicase [Verrucomicrobiales bacterium]
MPQPDFERVPPSHSREPVPPAEGVFGLLIPQLQRALHEEAYLLPTLVQAEAIPHLLEGRDLVASAQTGTGKTAAFVLPILQRLDAAWQRPLPRRPKVLILAPTRELAAQIGDSLSTYGRHLRIRHTVITGGVAQFPQVRALDQGVDIAVATPGRLLDLLEQRRLSLDNISCFVLDEVDRMLDMGFLPDIKRIIATLPEGRQSLFLSATLDRRMEELAQSLCNDPVRIAIARGQPTVERIRQRVLFVGKQNKERLLLSLLDSPGIRKAIVFTQMKHMASKVADRLEKEGISGTSIHGNKSQAARTRALSGFVSGRYRVLVATDVAARGIDVDGITHVINYDLPIEAENYVHRIGRTGRAGAEGEAISFCCAEERDMLRGIESLLRQPVPHDLDHGFHCEESRSATGPRARLAAKRNGGLSRFRRPHPGPGRARARRKD